MKNTIDLLSNRSIILKIVCYYRNAKTNHSMYEHKSLYAKVVRTIVGSASVCGDSPVYFGGGFNATEIIDKRSRFSDSHGWRVPWARVIEG